MLPWDCDSGTPGQSHIWGGRGGKSWAEMWEPPSPRLLPQLQEGSERRWAAVVQCRVPGILGSLLPLVPSRSPCLILPPAEEISSWAVRSPLKEPLPLPPPHRSCGSRRQPLLLTLWIPHSPLLHIGLHKINYISDFTSPDLGFPICKMGVMQYLIVRMT